MKILLASSALMLTAIAGGCASSIDTAAAPEFGAAVKQMQDEQTDPVTATSQAPQGSGEVGAAAQRRYRSGEVRPLAPPSTSATINSH